MVNLFHFIGEEMQQAYLPDFIDLETYEYVVKTASYEARIAVLKKVEDDPEPDDKGTNYKHLPSLILPLSSKDDEPVEDDYLKRERDEISDLLRSTTYGFSSVKKKSNDDILKRVSLYLTVV